MRILVTTEGAPHSDTAVRLGAWIAEKTGSEVTLLTIVGSATQRDAADDLLERARSFVPIAADRLTVLARVGKPSVEIIQEAERGTYDLLLVGERPLSKLVKRFFTQTADRIIKNMPCPVLLGRTPGPIRRILVCEGGQHPELLATLVGRLAPLLRAAEMIEVLHVMSQMTAAPGVRGWELRADAQEHMERHTPEGELLEHDRQLLGQLQVDLKLKMRHGVVVDEILSEAHRGEFDLIVVGASQVSGWQRLLSTDRIQQLLLRSELPFLIA